MFIFWLQEKSLCAIFHIALRNVILEMMVARTTIAVDLMQLTTKKCKKVDSRFLEQGGPVEKNTIRSMVITTNQLVCDCLLHAQ